ncbi:MAG: cobyrinic acid a,c-diamide synthase [Thauera sp.]|nr:cobyrinic acid a,c-diamide synthase [Thauera sp.]MCP5226810.1 cobyrinic acid a,c-diamide synthase [Thauera sp.]HPE03533.1 cobyrinic acid a,c-diamide synthase [Thauera sp.]
MFEFLQGIAFGLLVSFVPWFMAGMYDPRLVVPEELASRWQVILRYAVAMPSVATLLLLTSLWGGFGASLGGWLAGLAAAPAALFLERRWRRWREARAGKERAAARERARTELARGRRERDLLTLDPDFVPADADAVVMQLWEVKRELVGLRRPDLAVQADRLFTRYHRALDVLEDKFDRREVTYERARGLVGEVGSGAAAGLGAMVALVQGSVGLDADFVRERLEREAARLGGTEREALQRRLALADETERRLGEIAAGNEAALTALDHVAVAVARIDTGRGQPAGATEQALQELRRFAERAGLYGRQQ